MRMREIPKGGIKLVFVVVVVVVVVAVVVFLFYKL